MPKTSFWLLPTLFPKQGQNVQYICKLQLKIQQGSQSAVPNPFLKFCNQFELTKRFCRSSFVQLLTLGIFLKIMTFQIYQKNNVLGAQLLTSLKIDLCHDLNVFIVIQMPQRKIYLKELIGTDKRSAGLNISNMKERFQ